MKVFKKFTAVALAATLVFGSTITAFAADPTTEEGTGNVLDFKVINQVVPTALKVAINPNGYPVNIRYTAVASDASYSAGTKYYSYDSENDEYTLETITTGTSGNWATKLAAGLYTATTSNAQLVTFNYGLANLSTVDRNFTVKLDVSGDSKIVFVDEAAKAANEAAADDGGAKKGEYKIFLQLVPAKVSTAVTTATFAKATGDYDSSATYYTKSGNEYTKVTTNSEDAFDAGSYYVSTTTIGTEIMASELGDVTMTATTAPITFTAKDGGAYADVAYKLGKATYGLKADQFIDFSTEAGDLEAMFEKTAVGGVSGFTITGAMNTNTEWSALTTKTITITPTYKFEDSTGLETAVDTGLNQIEAGARTPASVAPSVPTSKTITAGENATIAVTLGSGSGAATGISALKWGRTADAATTTLTEGTHYTYADGTITLLPAVSNGASGTRYLKVEFTGGDTPTNDTVEVTIQ